MKSIIKKTVTLLIICSLVFSFAACGDKKEPPASSETTAAATSDTAVNEPGSSEVTTANAPPPSAKDTITVGVTQDMGTLDPGIITGVDLVYGVHLVYDPLWYVDENAELVLSLAESYEQPDELTLRIKLREGITFSNGNSFEADDVLWSLDHSNNRPGQPGLMPYLDVENSTIIDKYNIELKFTEFRVITLTGMAALMMFDKQTSEADPSTLDTHPIGTGPYVVTEYVVNSYLTLERRDEYWGKMPAIKTWNFVQLKEDSQRVNAVETGEVDIATVPYQDIEYVKELPGLIVDESPDMDQCLYFNISNTSIFYNNPDARRAVAYAIDRDAIARLAYSGKATIPNGPGVYAASPPPDSDERMYNLGIYSEGQNVELAAQLAESSGLTGKAIRFINNGSAAAMLASELIQADCKKAGITVDVKTLDMGTWTTYLFDDTQYDMCIDMQYMGTETMTSPWTWAYPFMAAGSYTNVNYDYPGRDRMIEIMDIMLTTEDVDARREWGVECAVTAVDNMLWFNLVCPIGGLAMNENIKGTIRNGYGVVALYRNLYWE